jgi:multidrug efflux pump subunit AcrB
MTRRADAEQFSANGGLARYFVEHRQVGWMALFAVLIWGVVSYRLLPQQEDPSLPPRIARVVCVMPGATASRVEELVTEPLEKKIKELQSIQR